MQQLAVIAAGVQQWHRAVVTSSPRFFAYCSSLSIYVYSYSTQQLQCVVPCKTTLTCCALCPLNDELLVFGAKDASLVVWNVEQDAQVAVSPAMKGHCVQCDWSTLAIGLVAAVTSTGDVYTWRVGTSEYSINCGNMGGVATCVAWKPNSAILAAGLKDGSVTLKDTSSRQTRRLKHQSLTKPCEVVAFDPRSPTYLLTLFQGGQLALWDETQASVVTVFDVVANSFAGVAWMGPGEFITCDSASSVVRAWNVAQKTPVSHARVSSASIGFTAMCAALPVPPMASGAGPQRTPAHMARCIVVGTCEGGVGLYDTKRRQYVVHLENYHTETVFDCAFHPTNGNVFTTAGYDGRVVTWNLRTLKPIAAVHCGSLVYSISWNPDGRRIAAATVSGKVFVVDMEEARVLLQVHAHKDASHRVAWTSANSIISSGRDGLCIETSLPDGRVLRSLRHESAVFGMSVNPARPGLVAVGCEDGLVYVWNSEQRPRASTLRGHTARVFHVAWSPSNERLLASGSDDTTIRLWDVDTGSCLHVLHGHTNHVRPLLWHPMLSSLLISGSWDGHICLWDTQTGRLLSNISAHFADVYGISVHPDSPFLLVSSSRDTTVRLWHVQQPIEAARLLAITGTPLDRVADEAGPLTLAPAGPRWQAAISASQRQLSPLERATLYLSLFGGPLGTFELLELVEAHSSAPPSDLVPTPSGSASGVACRVTHRLHVAALQQARAKAIAAGRGTSGSKRSERLRESAVVLALAGHLQEAVNAFVQAGDWSAALAIAPAVSVDMWRSVADRFSREQGDLGGLDMQLSVQMALGEREGVVRSLLAAQRYEDAWVATHASPAVTQPATQSIVPGHAAGTVAQQLSQAVESAWSHAAIAHGDPMLASMVHLANDAPAAAVSVLTTAGELEVAFMLAHVCKLPLRPLVVPLARRMAALGLRKQSVAFANSHDLTMRDRALLALFMNAQDEDRLFLDLGLQERQYYMTMAASASRRQPDRAVLDLCLAGLHEEAANVGLDTVSAALAAPDAAWSLRELRRVLEPLWHLAPAALSILPRFTELHAVTCALALMEASLHGYWAIFEALATRANNGAPAKLIEAAVGSAVHAAVVAGEYALAHRLRATATLSAAASLSIDMLLAHCSGATGAGTSAVAGVAVGASAAADGALASSSAGKARASLSVVGGLLPAGLSTGARDVSAISGGVVRGPQVTLSNGEIVSRSEALMWAAVCPLSPVRDGTKMF